MASFIIQRYRRLICIVKHLPIVGIVVMTSPNYDTSTMVRLLITTAHSLSPLPMRHTELQLVQNCGLA